MKTRLLNILNFSAIMLAWAIGGVVHYLMASFTFLTLDYTEWSDSGRTMFAVVGVLALIVGFLLYIMEVFEKAPSKSSKPIRSNPKTPTSVDPLMKFVRLQCQINDCVYNKKGRCNFSYFKKGEVQYPSIKLRNNGTAYCKSRQSIYKRDIAAFGVILDKPECHNCGKSLNGHQRKWCSESCRNWWNRNKRRI